MFAKENFRICTLDSEKLNSQALDSQNFRAAFSSLELVIVLCLFGILAFSLVRIVNANLSQVCIQHLKVELLAAQGRINQIYFDEFLANAQISQSSVQIVKNALNTLQVTSQSKNAKCNFSYTHPILRANIYDHSLDFEIEPIDLQINPKIFCDYENELCRRFFNKTLDN